MSDWQVGDLAVCVECSGPCAYCDSEGECPEGPAPPKGEVCEVRAIDTDPYWTVVHGLVGLAVGSYGFAVSCAFRKVIPDAPEACEEEFVTLLQRIKRKVAA